MRKKLRKALDDRNIVYEAGMGKKEILSETEKVLVKSKFKRQFLEYPVNHGHADYR